MSVFSRVFFMLPISVFCDSFFSASESFISHFAHLTTKINDGDFILFQYYTIIDGLDDNIYIFQFLLIWPLKSFWEGPGFSYFSKKL